VCMGENGWERLVKKKVELLTNSLAILSHQVNSCHKIRRPLSPSGGLNWSKTYPKISKSSLEGLF
jgi:hypothetical protein